MRRHRNLIWGLAAVGTALVLVLNRTDSIPEGVFDLLQRGWPGLLILVGLTLLLRDRVPLSGALAVILSLGMVGGVAFTSYSNRANEFREDQQITIAEDIDPGVSLLAVNINTLETDVEIARSTTDNRTISGTFIGSTESTLEIDYEDHNDGTAEFTLNEIKSDEIPALDTVGRGVLSIALPADVAIALAFAGADGPVTANLNDVDLERLSLEVDDGDIAVTLPAYLPLSPNARELPGQIATSSGDVVVLIQENVAGRFELNRGGNNRRPEFDDAYILIDDGADGTLEKRNIAEEDIPLYYAITAPNGLITLQIAEN